jgi:multidrug resistance efflux pump
VSTLKPPTPKTPIVLGALALVAGGAAGCWYLTRPTTTLELPGTVEVQEVRLGSKVGGRVAEVFVKEGDRVEANRQLVRFAAPELEAQHEQWTARKRQAEVTFQKAEAGPQPEEKEAAWAAAKSAAAKSTMMAKGFRDEEVRRADAEAAAAQADLDFASKEWRRIDELAKTRNATKTELDDARKNLENATSRLDAAVANRQMIRSGMRAEERDAAAWEAKRLEALARLADKGTRSEDLSLAQYAVHEAAARLKEIEAMLAETVVRAPGPARVEIVGVRPGDLAPPNQPVIRVLLDDDLWVKAYVPETDLGYVKVGQKVEVTIDSHPGRRFAGEIVHLSGVSEFTPRNIQSADQRRHQVFGFKVRVLDADDVFKAGMAAVVHLAK